MEPGHVIVLLLTVSALHTAAAVDSVRCSDVTRLGKSLQHVEPPPSCRGDGGAAWCDTPGTDYPWQEIRDYLRRSSEEVTKRTGQLDPGDIQRLLTKYGLAKTRIAAPRRKGRAADVTGTRDVTSQQLVREAGRVTSRSGGWESGIATSATEPTNFELREESQDGNRNGGARPASKRINDKDLSEEDELVLLLTYFSSPNNIVFTKSVLGGILRIRDPVANGDEQTEKPNVATSQDTSSSGDPRPQGSQYDDEEQNKNDTKKSEPTDDSLKHTVDPPSTVLNETIPERQDAASTSAEALKISGETSERLKAAQTTLQSDSAQIPSRTASQPLSPSTDSPARSPESSSDAPTINPTTASSSSVTASSTSSSTTPASVYPDTERRHPALSSPGDAIFADTRTGQGSLPGTRSGSPPGTRTGADVLAEIRTGDDILSDITGAEEAEPQRHQDWAWDDAQLGGWAGEEQDSWTDGEQDSWTDESPDSWSDESLPPEVQYYRPTESPFGRPDAADGFEWHDSPVAAWRPLPAPPPQADSLLARLPERVPLEGEKDPERGDGVVMEYGQRVMTTGKPVTMASTAADLTLLEETVYTTAIYQPDEEGGVSPTAAMSAVALPTISTVETLKVSPTTPDPYVMSACQTSVEVRSPFYAMNTQNVWKMLINIPPFETYIHMEHCVVEHERGLCAAGCRCTQRHTVRNMPVYVRDADGCDRIYMDKFLFPSHCDCMCLPRHHALFNLTRSPQTTPATSVGVVDNSTLFLGPVGGASGETAPPSWNRANSTFPPRVTDGASAEALKAAGLAARVVTAAPTWSPASRSAPELPPRTPPPRRPVVPAAALVRSHRNRNRGPAFPSPLRRHSSTDSVTRRNGRADDTLRQDGRYDGVPPPLPRR